MLSCCCGELDFCGVRVFGVDNVSKSVCCALCICICVTVYLQLCICIASVRILCLQLHIFRAVCLRTSFATPRLSFVPCSHLSVCVYRVRTALCTCCCTSVFQLSFCQSHVVHCAFAAASLCICSCAFVLICSAMPFCVDVDAMCECNAVQWGRVVLMLM